jgi:TM2 domain-containing membrane protein YozV
MTDTLDPNKIKEKTQLILEGRYWDALELTSNSCMGEIDTRIFTLMEGASGNSEFKSLLLKVKNRCASGNYQKVTGDLWNPLYPRLDENVARLVLGIVEEDISRKTTWERAFENNIDLPVDAAHTNIQSELRTFFRIAGNILAKNGEDQLSAYPNKEEVWARSIKALKKGVFCLNMACDYSNTVKNREYAKQRVIEIEQIQKNYEREAKAKGFSVPNWPETSTPKTPSKIEVPVAVSPGQKGNVLESGIPDILRPFLEQIHGVLPPPPHTEPIPQTGEPKRKTTQSNQPVSKPLPVNKPVPNTKRATDTPLPPIKKLGPALAFSILLGWLGVDRFYLGLKASGILKLAMFMLGIGLLIVMGPGLAGWPILIMFLWWILDIILVTGRRLKDNHGRYIG